MLLRLSSATDAVREQLRQLVDQWNENRLDLFSLSYPTEDLEIHGVMRFYFQESKEKVATKCIRVSSTATTRAVIEALVEKFHPDLKMLTNPEYTLWEVHENGEERCLSQNEKPLLVQLNWHKDDREGRFLLRKHPFPPKAYENGGQQKRFSKKEEKEMKKKHQKALTQEEENVASDIYKVLPATTFTRTISNPEVVMKKRREKKLQAKLKGMRQGGSLKIFGYEIEPSKPYVTLLVSLTDCVSAILAETLQKYGIEGDVNDYVLIETVIPSSTKLSRSLSDLRTLGSDRRERVMDYDECPWISLASRVPNSSEEMLFVIRKKSVVRDSVPQLPQHHLQRTRHASLCSASTYSTNYADPQRLFRIGSLSSRLPETIAVSPCLLQVTAGVSSLKPIMLPCGVTDIGSDYSVAIYLEGGAIRPRHAVLNYKNRVVTVTPSDPNAEIEIDGRPVHQTVVLCNSCMLQFGRVHLFRYFANVQFAMVYIDDLLKANHTNMDFGNEPNCARLTPPVKTISNDRSGTALNEQFGQSQIQFIDTLPAFIEVRDEAEDVFLQHVISMEVQRIQFKLAPAFAIYMAARQRLVYPLDGISDADNRTRTLVLLTKAANLCHGIGRNSQQLNSLAYWLANASELLNFCKQDVELSSLTHGMPQQILADCVETTFDLLSICVKNSFIPVLTVVRDTTINDSTASRSLTDALEATMQTFRLCQLNAALTIQLFSQLFYYCSAALFNWLISPNGAPYCSRAFGVRLRTRLSAVNEWALEQGLELAAECHMDHINQAITLLITPKTTDQISTLGATCYKLNSEQVRWLLEHIVFDVSEESLSMELTETIVHLAQTHADQMAAQDGKKVKLDEDLHLQLPFLLPQDGYSPERIRGFASAFAEYISILQTRGICRLSIQAHSTGSWSVYMKSIDADSNDAANIVETLPISKRLTVNDVMLRPDFAPMSAQMVSNQSCQHLDERTVVSDTQTKHLNSKVITVEINRGSGGIGLSIVAAQGIGERSIGIYVKKVVEGSAAHRDRRLECGDQLLSVNGQSLIGIGQEEAAAKMSSSGPIVTFEVYKHAAHYNGLAEWLINPPSTQADHAVPTSLEAVARDASPRMNRVICDTHIFPRRNSATSTSSHYSNTTYTGSHEPVRSMPQTLNKNYSASASELYHTQTGASSSVLLSSVPLPRDRAGTPIERHPVSAVETLSTQRTYNRNYQRPIVIQPSRPSPVPALRQNRSRSPHVPFQQAANNSLLVTDYANLPLIEDSKVGVVQPLSYHHHPEALYDSASQTHQTNRPETPRSDRSSARDHTSLTSESSRDSLRSSAYPQVVACVPSHAPATVITEPSHIVKRIPPIPPKRRTRREELNEQLDRLEQKGVAMTEVDRQTYRQLVNELAKIRLPPPDSSSAPRCADNRTVAGQSYENPVERSSETAQSDLLVKSDRVTLPNPDEEVKMLDVDTVIKDLDGERDKQKGDVNASDQKAIAESAETSSTVPNKIALLSPDLSEPENKCTDWNGVKDMNEEKVESAQTNSSLIYEDEEPPGPRVQVLGAQEVYRDPRQRRLEEMRMRENAAGNKVDGAKLGFRDKMQLFAEQIGDKTVKNRLKTSAVQREIEQTMTDDP